MTPYSVNVAEGVSKLIDILMKCLGISYRQLTQQILPLASYYSITVRFVEEKDLPEAGQVNHALRGALRCLLKDYLVCKITNFCKGKGV